MSDFADTGMELLENKMDRLSAASPHLTVTTRKMFVRANKVSFYVITSQLSLNVLNQIRATFSRSLSDLDVCRSCLVAESYWDPCKMMDN